jgi:hypothetical protein
MSYLTILFKTDYNRQDKNLSRVFKINFLFDIEFSGIFYHHFFTDLKFML